MNMFRRLFHLSFVAVLLLSVLALAVSAEGTKAVASSDFLVHQGEEFQTTIYIPDGANIIDFDISLEYDPEILTLVNIQENEDIKGSITFNNSTAGSISINYTRTSKNVTSYQPLLDLSFRVSDDAGIGNYPCLSVKKDATYIAHRLNSTGALEAVDFSCSFSRLVIYEMGDVDLSENVDIGDATYIRRHLAQFEGAIFNEFKLTLADTRYDGEVDIADAVVLQRRLARLDGTYGNRVNITFKDRNGNTVVRKSVVYNGTLTSLPKVPAEPGFSDGNWSTITTGYVKPNLTKLQSDITLYAVYGQQDNPAMDNYKSQLTKKYFSGDLPTNLSSNLSLDEKLTYQQGWHAKVIWSSDCNYVLNQTTGEFIKPTYPKKVNLTAHIISYDAKDQIDAEDSITFEYAVPGRFRCPTKNEIRDYLNHYFTNGGKFRVNYDVKLLAKISSAVLPESGTVTNDYEVRLAWYENVNGVLTPINRISRTTVAQVCDYVAVATFNGEPIEGDGKIYIDNVEVTAIEEEEIKNYIITEIAANQGALATEGVSLWDKDTRYGTKVTWETGAPKIAYIANNTIQLQPEAVTGQILPVNARVSYKVDGGAKDFVLSYNLTVSCNNTIIRAPENMDPELYRAIKAELEENLGYRGDLTAAALASVKFVNLDLSSYPEISSLRGLSYCRNLRTLNISGLHINDGSINQIATLSYLEAFIARGCGLDNLSDGGQATLRNAVNLSMIDLTDNHFTSLDSVFAPGIRYGKLREVYLASNRLTNISALQRAPLLGYLSLADNGLTTEGISVIADFPALSYLSLANNRIDSVAPLKNLSSLQELRLHNNQLSNVDDLRRLVNLEILYLGHNSIRDIGNLNTLTQLKVLYANDNLLTSISNLKNLRKLEIINVSNNNLNSLTVLGNYSGSLYEIYAENNNITDFSFINNASKLSFLMLAGNKTEMVQENLNAWLSEMPEMKVLTLSGIQLSDLSFLANMQKLVRLDIADCGLRATSNSVSNVQMIAGLYSTLKVLNVSNNDFNDGGTAINSLRSLNKLTVLYADNVHGQMDANSLTYSMPELRYISLENSGILNMSWLSKYDELRYVDLAGNKISSVDLENDISRASAKKIKELYLDTTVPCQFADAFRVMDLNLERLSLHGVSIERMEKMPPLEEISYLNLSNTGLENLTGADMELQDMYSVERYSTVKTIDVSNLDVDISPLEEMSSLETIYAVGLPDSARFYEKNLHALQRLSKSGITCYLYDRDTVYVPDAEHEGKVILDLLDDYSCEVGVAAENKFTSNNPTLPEEINEYKIQWTVSNEENYEIRENQLAVKSYQGIEDEDLIVTASITVYPDQEPVSREFTFKTSIVRVTPNHIQLQTEGYLEQMTREHEFKFGINLLALPHEGFNGNVLPVADVIAYTYAAATSAGNEIPYPNVLTEQGNGSFVIDKEAPLRSTLSITINVGHALKDGTQVYDVDPYSRSLTIVSRTYMATFELNGGTMTDANGVTRNVFQFAEETELFTGLTYGRRGYFFGGWYLDEDLTELFSEDGTEGIMPPEDFILYAAWIPRNYKLIFDAAEGTVEKDSKLCLVDVEVGELPVPKREHYDFTGWYTAQNKLVTADTIMDVVEPVEDVTLHAQWTPTEYSITTNMGEGCIVTIKRTESPIKKAQIGVLGADAKVYVGDVLQIQYTTQRGYILDTFGDTDITVESNVGPDCIFATATHAPLLLRFALNDSNDEPAYLSETELVTAQGTPVGELPEPKRAYYDFAGWFASNGEEITESSSFVADNGEITLYAHWNIHPESDWVLRSEVPGNAKVVRTSYSYHEIGESTNAQADGWSRTGNYRWQQSNNGSFYYASFPSGFDTNNWVYQEYYKGPAEAYENETSKREVSNWQDGWIYWHWMYNVNYASGTGRAIADHSGTGKDTGFGYYYFYSIVSNTDCPKLGSGYTNGSSLPTYNCNSIIPSGDRGATSGLGTDRFFRFNRMVSSYTDYVKYYEFARDISFGSDPGNGPNISNKVEYVKYRVQ